MRRQRVIALQGILEADGLRSSCAHGFEIAMSLHLLTVGHSNHDFATFATLLRQHQVTAVADVRSAPYSRRYQHFNK